MTRISHIDRIGRICGICHRRYDRTVTRIPLVLSCNVAILPFFPLHAAPTIRIEISYLSAIPSIQPIGPPAQPMHTAATDALLRSHRFPRIHVMPKNVLPALFLSRCRRPCRQWTLPMLAIWRCRSCAGLFARPRLMPAAAPHPSPF